MRTNAQKRYDERSPVISVRLTPFLKAELGNYMKEGETYPNVIRRILYEIKNIETSKKEARREGCNDCYWKAIEKADQHLSITYPCARCREPIAIHQNDPIHQTIVRFLLANGYGHSTCPNRQFYIPPPQQQYYRPYW